MCVSFVRMYMCVVYSLSLSLSLSLSTHTHTHTHTHTQGQYYQALVAKNAAGETALALALARDAPEDVISFLRTEEATATETLHKLHQAKKIVFDFAVAQRPLVVFVVSAGTLWLHGCRWLAVLLISILVVLVSSPWTLRPVTRASVARRVFDLGVFAGTLVLLAAVPTYAWRLLVQPQPFDYLSGVCGRMLGRSGDPWVNPIRALHAALVWMDAAAGAPSAASEHLRSGVCVRACACAWKALSLARSLSLSYSLSRL